VPLKAVILVGGQGTRLQPLSSYLPKPMVPVLNRPSLEHTIAYLKRYGIKEIILALSYLPEVIQDYFGDGRRWGVSLTYSVEATPLGTAGAVKRVEEQLNGTFAVLNGDIFTDLDITDMVAFHRRRGARATISLVWVADPSAFGVVETGAEGRVSRFVEKPPAGSATTNWINAGTYILEPEVLAQVPAESHYMFEKGLFPDLLQRGEGVYGYPFSGYWLDMGTPRKYLQLNCDLLRGEATSWLVRGVGRDGIGAEEDISLHPSTTIEGPVVIGRRCEIGRGVYIKGPVVIGPRCQVEANATIATAVLWGDSHIGRGARVENCIICRHTVLGRDHQAINCVVCADGSGIKQVAL